MEIPLDLLHLLIFTVPGFFFVWSYMKGKGRKIESDFAYFIFSFFWGLVILGLLGWIMPRETLDSLFENIYTATLILSLVSILLGATLGGLTDKYFDKYFEFIFKKKK